MEAKATNRLDTILRKYKNNKRWRGLVRTLACLVVFCTTYALILPALTLEKTAYCGEVEHTHEASCYDDLLICDLTEGAVHEHDANCYMQIRNLICGLKETDGHIHGEECFLAQSVLMCESEDPDHVHDRSCYREEQILICEQEEMPSHTHDDICYEDEEIITCSIDTENPHTHSAICYKMVQICGMEEHRHVEVCYCESENGLEGVADNSLIAENLEPEKESTVLEGESAESEYAFAQAEDVILSEQDEESAEEAAESLEEEAADSEADDEDPAEDSEGPEEELPVGVQRYSDDVIEITVRYPEEAMIPEEAVLLVRRLDSIPDATESYRYEIGFYLDEQEIEPEAPVAIEAKFIGGAFDHAQSIGVIHYKKEVDDRIVPENIGTEVSSDQEGIVNVSFELDSFSQIEFYALAEPGTIVTSTTALANAIAAGGTVTLGADLQVNNTISITGGTHLLDLNGHKLTSAVAGPLFEIAGGTLTVMDSVGATETVETVEGVAYGHTASYVNNNLTYYVTETQVIDSGVGSTQETLKKHTVTGGGMIVGSAADGHAFRISGGKLIINSGIICNFHSTDNGGAVYMTGGKMEVNGGVLAANRGAQGGAIAMNGQNNTNPELDMTGGVISGNVSTTTEGNEGNSTGGGGILAYNGATINMSGGFVTNNVTTGNNYFAGGGAFLLKNSTLNLSGGYITGNEGNGGGAVKTARGQAGKLVMSGGFITANHARGAEGGGVNLDSNGLMEMSAGYVTNNIAGGGVGDTDFPHWGGGGLFCCDGNATITVTNASITGNAAGGFGGGVAGCSTGRIDIVMENGAAVYNNTAQGTHTSGDTSAKNDDRTYALHDPVFMANGFEDYYCALSSSVSGGMLGGSIAHWTGSKDGEAVTSDSDSDVLVAAYIMGLTAHPSAADIQEAKGVATSYITGNVSPTHGGGILANGYLVIGATNEVENYCRLELTAAKSLIDQNGENKSLEGHVFEFSLKDEYGNEVSRGQNDSQGQITFNRRIPFEKDGTTTFYLSELTSTAESNKGIINDDSRYRIDVTVVRNDIGLLPGTQIHSVLYRFSNVKVTDTKTQEVIYNRNPGNDETHAVHLDPTGGRGFVNHEVEHVSVKVKKTWHDGAANHTNGSVAVTLLSDGEQATGSGITNPVTLNSGNNWTYEWTELDPNHVYTISEGSVTGYLPTYSYSYNNNGTTMTISNEAYLYWNNNGSLQIADKITLGDSYYIGNADGTKVLMITADHRDNGFTAADVVSVNENANALPENARFVARKNTTNGNDRTSLMLASNETVGLLVQPSNGNYLKGTTGNLTYSSGFQIVHEAGKNLLKGQNDWGTNNSWRYVIFDNGTQTFTTAESITTLQREVFTGANLEVTVTNTPVSEIDFTLNLRKVDEKNTSRALPGAEFQLIRADGQALRFIRNANTGRYEITDSTGSGTTDTLVSANNGYIRVDKIPGGTYTLRETHAPSGFDKVADQVVVLNENTANKTLDLTIADPELTYLLPETGGMGTSTIYMIGAVLMVCSLLFLFLRGRHEL